MDRMKRDIYIGIDIGGTKCTIIAGTKDLQILERVQFDTETLHGPDYTINKLIENAFQILHNQADANLKSIGISCGGPLDSKNGIIKSPPNLPGWDEIHIVDIIKNKFNVPVYLQNDANACALAEWRLGAGRGTKNMVYLTFGTGLGAGLILDGRLYTGTNDLAGEVGHIRLSETGPEGYGKNGSFESFCSGAGIARMVQDDFFDEHPDNHEGNCDLTSKDLAGMALNGDKKAIELFHISGKYLGMGLSIIIDLINPQRIVIGSIYARNTNLFDEALMEVVEKEALKPAAEVCEIVPAALGDEVGDYASLIVAMMTNDSNSINE
jgi:glucokinase